MKLPNCDRAILDIAKLRDSCLNPLNPEGRHKARVFAAYGVRVEDAEELRNAILLAIQQTESCLGELNEHGQRYRVDLELVCKGRTLRVRTAWIVRNSEDLPRLTTCFVL